MSFINCIICGESASVVGKPNHVIRKVRCKRCGVIDINYKKNKQPEILFISSSASVKQEDC